MSARVNIELQLCLRGYRRRGPPPRPSPKGGGSMRRGQHRVAAMLRGYRRAGPPTPALPHEGGGSKRGYNIELQLCFRGYRRARAPHPGPPPRGWREYDAGQHRVAAMLPWLSACAGPPPRPSPTRVEGVQARVNIELQL